MGRLDGKVGIITGAGSGIGQAIAVLFAKEGAKVVVNDLVTKGGKETVAMIKESGGEASFAKGDVSKVEDVKNMVKTAIDMYRRLDVLVNNAAVSTHESMTDLTEEHFERVIGVNIRGVWLGMKYAIPEMIKTGGGSIINVSSIASDVAFPDSFVYTASKGGVNSMSRVAAVECGIQKIRVNVIKPGIILTPLSRRVNSPEVLKEMEEETPLGRLGEPEDVAYLALFLASDESSYITGQKLAVDGGVEIYSHMG